MFDCSISFDRSVYSVRLFECSRSPLSPQTVIALGHSLWFKSFFDVYLPKGADMTARKRKIGNCAVVALTLQRGTVGARITPVSPLASRFEPPVLPPWSRCPQSAALQLQPNANAEVAKSGSRALHQRVGVRVLLVRRGGTRVHPGAPHWRRGT